MEKIAEIAEDPFMDLDLSNITTTESSPTYEKDPLQSILTTVIITTQLIEFFLGMANISANIFLMHVIRRFKRLRTRSNFYIFNYALANIFVHITLPFMEILLHSILGISHSKIITLFCFVYSVIDTALFLCFVFPLILAIDWYVTSYHTQYILTYKKFYKWLIYIMYCISLVKYVIDVSLCAGFHAMVTHYFLVVLYIIVLLTLIVVNYLIRNKKASNIEEEKKTKYCVTIANFIILSWLPLYAYHILYTLFESVYFIRMALEFTYFIPQWIATINSIVVVYLLGRLNKYFKIAYKLSFKRSLKEYEHDGFDDSDCEPTVRHSTVSNDGGSNNTSNGRRNKFEENDEKILNV